MFWRFGGYANISTIDTLLEKPDVTLEELLDESDLIQELKQHNTKLIEFLREDKILERLLEYVIAPKLELDSVENFDVSEENQLHVFEKGKYRTESELPRLPSGLDQEKEKNRNRYAYVAAEVLSSDNWSICEALMENQEILKKFWYFLKLPPPLDPLQASYFTKVNESLLDKKTEEMLDLFKSLDGVVKNMLQHVDSPMIMDLLLKIISLEKAEGGQGIVNWLHSQDLMPILLSFLSSEHSWATQTSAGDFLKAIITISANASQNEQSCIGPNELTRQLVSQPCIEKLISDMLKGGNPLTVGVGIVIEVIRKNNSDYDPDVGAETNLIPSSRDPIYLGTLLRMFSQRVPDFMELILSPNHTIGSGDNFVTIRRKELKSAFGGKIEPLGFDRFKTCELMAELLHCSNMGLLNEVGSEEFVNNRDIERARLKAEGKLGLLIDAPSDEDLTMKSSHTRSDQFKKLQVYNVSDDDGFEQVNHSTDIGDEAKDGFDERPESKHLTKHEDFRDKHDLEFMDEPLSSPRLMTEDLNLHEPDITQFPLSLSKADSTSECAQQAEPHEPEEKYLVTCMPAIDTAVVRNESIPPKSIEPLLESKNRSANKDLPTSEDVTQEVVEKLSEVIDELKIDVPNDTPDTTIEKTIDLKKEETTTAELSPNSVETLDHPEDKPAPLFMRKSESVEPGLVLPPAPDVATTAEVEALNVAVARNSDNSHLIHLGSTDDPLLSVLSTAPPVPVVGDFLKMQFVEHKVVPTILDFFFRFPWNNFLHNVVYDVVQQVFNGPMDRGFNRSLAIDLFETGDITMRIVDGQKKSDEAQEKNKMRLGYMGHLTLIAEEVVKFTERHPPELLSNSVLEKVINGEWTTYVEVTLAETRERDNAILGGVRPEITVGPRQAVMNAVNAASGFGGASSALTEAGLTGSVGLDSIELANGINTSGFAIGGGTLLSGFGSSSDEEDDELDDENDDDGRNNGAEFSRYISTPSTTTASTSILPPPAAPPPPPPPLNIAPSRARRQLAARLALHKQNTELAVENEDIDTPGNRKRLNPFATDEDDEMEGDFGLGYNEGEKNVGIPDTSDEHLPVVPALLAHVLFPPSNFSTSSFTPGIGRAGFPSLWPFSGGKGNKYANKSGQGGNVNSDGSGSGSDDECGGGDQRGRNLSSTIEARRRTSLEDDDDDLDGVVHVGMAEADIKEAEEKSGNEVEADDGELVEFMHAETQAGVK